MTEQTTEQSPLSLTCAVPTMAAGTEPAPPRPPGRPRDQATRERILNAALVELAQVGYQRLAVERVAALAGAGKATIYRWWGGAPELIAEALSTQEMPEESRELIEMLRRERTAGGLRSIIAEAAWPLMQYGRER